MKKAPAIIPQAPFFGNQQAKESEAFSPTLPVSDPSPSVWRAVNEPLHSSVQP